MSRIIGIRHRIKFTAEGEARPTQLVIEENGKQKVVDLATEDDELDFVMGRLPTGRRAPEPGENHTQYVERHLTWRPLKDGESVAATAITREVKKDRKSTVTQILTHVPSGFDGLREGDTVAMIMGGSGDNLAYALSRRGEEVGGRVYRTPVLRLGDMRAKPKDATDDAKHLVKLLQEQPDIFYLTGPRDRQMIAVREAFRARTEVMKDRIACGQRVRQGAQGQIFRSQDGQFPEGEIEAVYDHAQANDVIHSTLVKEEKRCIKELEAALNELPIYREILSVVDGVGPLTAARIVAGVIDIRRFPKLSGFEKFCGVSVDDGKFLRRRRGVVANWNPEVRQAFYLLGESFNKNPNSFWGQKLLEFKIKLREKHPEEIEVDGKKRYTKGHIHKMALWRTRTRFARFVYKAWWQFEREHEQAKAAA